MFKPKVMKTKTFFAFFVMFLVFFGCNKEIDPENNNSDDPEIIDIDVAEYTVPYMMQYNKEDHEETSDYIWSSSSEITITLKSTYIECSSSVVTIDGTVATITAGGNYRITGSLSNGQIIVESTDDEIVRLILDGVNVNCNYNAPLDIESSDKTIIILTNGTQNYFSDTENYVFASAEEDEPNATIFSKDDLSIYGTGTLTVSSNYNDGITSKDGLVINSGTISVTSVDDGIRGKDYLVVKNGTITVNSEGDGIKSDNDEDTTKGYILVENGTLNITSENDGIQAETDALVKAGTLTIKTGGGYSAYIGSDISAKAIKSGSFSVIDGGTFDLNTADDAIHSDKCVVINNGNYTISTGDDGAHADSILTINNGTININSSYEGLESCILVINDGSIDITSSDDGINVASGNDGSGVQPPHPGDDFSSSGDNYLYLNGGYISVNANGDGLDANGSIVMTGGTVLVHGPTGNDNGALDYDSGFKITGGILVAVGSAGMAQAPSSSSTQYCVSVRLSSTQQAGSLFNIQSTDGDNIVTFKSAKSYQAIVVSSPDFTTEKYNLYLGGSSSGTLEGGLYSDGTYTPGNKYTSFTISNIITTVN